VLGILIEYAILQRMEQARASSLVLYLTRPG
jgi:hypothetical protein